MPRGPVFMLDTMWAGAGGPPNPKLLERDAYLEMIKTAQNLATQYEIPREEIDAFALRSHRNAAAARDSGRFGKEIFAVETPAGRKGETRTFERRRIDPRRHEPRTARRAGAAAGHPGDDGR